MERLYDPTVSFLVETNKKDNKCYVYAYFILFKKGQCTLINVSTCVHHVNVPD